MDTGSGLNDAITAKLYTIFSRQLRAFLRSRTLFFSKFRSLVNGRVEFKKVTKHNGHEEEEEEVKTTEDEGEKEKREGGTLEKLRMTNSRKKLSFKDRFKEFKDLRKEGGIKVTTAVVSEQVKENERGAELIFKKFVKKVSIPTDETIIAMPIVIDPVVEFINIVEGVKG